MAPGIEDKIRITTEAVNWIHRLEAEPEEATADEFAGWLRKSPHHLPSFLKQSRIETAMRRVRAERIAQRREASQHAPASNAPATVNPERKRWMRRALVATPLVTLAIFIAPPLTTKPTLHGSPSTEVDVHFADGSTVKLPPGTQIREERFAWFRKITLVHGAAQFFVEHRILQSFQVQTDNARITSTGTQFNVLRTDERTGVHVVDGSVRVESSVPGNGTVQPKKLHAGESVDVSLTGEIGNFHQAPPPATAGSGGTVPLTTVVDEINRRNLLPQIVIEGKIGEQRFERPHKALTPNAWLASLANYSDFKVEQHGDLATIRAAGPRESQLR